MYQFLFPNCWSRNVNAEGIFILLSELIQQMLQAGNVKLIGFIPSLILGIGMLCKLELCFPVRICYMSYFSIPCSNVWLWSVIMSIFYAWNSISQFCAPIEDFLAKHVRYSSLAQDRISWVLEGCNRSFEICHFPASNSIGCTYLHAFRSRAIVISGTCWTRKDMYTVYHIALLRKFPVSVVYYTLEIWG